MGVEGCYKCMKYTLVAFNVLVLLVGGAVLGLGIYTLTTDYGVSDMVALLGSNDLYKAGVYLLIAIGGATVLISFFGCCGAAMESRCLLGLYFAVMLVLSICFLAACIVGFIFRDNITGHLKREATSTLMYKYGSDPEITAQWDNLQQELKCCGMSGGINSNSSWAIYKTSTDWFQNQGNNNGRGVQYVPFSCCVPNGNLEVCVGRASNTMQPPKMGPPVEAPLVANSELYSVGCYDILDDYLEDNALIIGGVAIGAFFIMVLGTIFSICLCCQISRQGFVV